MKYLLFTIVCCTACATWPQEATKAWQCQYKVCPEVAAHEYAGTDTSTYDPLDDSCICRFRDGRVYYAPSKL